MAEDKISKAERLMKEYHCKLKSLESAITSPREQAGKMKTPPIGVCHPTPPNKTPLAQLQNRPSPRVRLSSNSSVEGQRAVPGRFFPTPQLGRRPGTTRLSLYADVDSEEEMKAVEATKTPEYLYSTCIDNARN